MGGIVQPCPCRQAKERLAALEDASKMHPFAEAPYDAAKGEPVPEIAGYKNISNEPKALLEHGLSPEMLVIPGTKFQAQVFEKGNEVIVAFKGTDPLSLSDWQNNFNQGLGRESAYYSQAQLIAKSVAGSRAAGAPPAHFVGHSLGGGLASAAAAATGYPATTFNAAGLNARNVGSAVASNVNAVKVRGEILTSGVNNMPRVPDVFASKTTMVDPPLSFGRDVVLPALGGLLGGLGVAGALAARAVMLHLNPAIKASIDSELKQAEKDKKRACG